MILQQLRMTEMVKILGETQGKRRDATCPVGVYILLLATE